MGFWALEGQALDIPRFIWTFRNRMLSDWPYLFFVYTKRLLDVITLQVPPILLLIRGAEGELLYGEKIVRTEVNVVFVKL